MKKFLDGSPHALILFRFLTKLSRVWNQTHNPKQKGPQFTQENRIEDVVLSQYVRVGEQELANENFKDLLKLKNSATSDAVAELGPAQEIEKMSGGLQSLLH
jgi:hypothetical protein